MKQSYKSPAGALLFGCICPGFGQLYNRDYFLGLLFLALEFIINVNSNINLAIYYTFIGRFSDSFNVLNFQWALFYPSIYLFSAWEGYNRAMDINYQLEIEGIPRPKEPTRFIGPCFGAIVGFNFGIYWLYLGSPIAGGLLGIFLGSILGGIIEKIVLITKKVLF